jgi:glycerate kinase
VFAPQKGATPQQVEAIEQNLAHFSRVVERGLTLAPHAGRGEGEGNISKLPGSGAAGGLGFGLAVFCKAKLVPGIESFLDLVEADRGIRAADIVIVGEGTLDATTLAGKAPAGIARRAAGLGKRVAGVFGSIAPAPKDLPKKIGIEAWRSSKEEAGSLQRAMAKPHFYLVKAAYQLARGLYRDTQWKPSRSW